MSEPAERMDREPRWRTATRAPLWLPSRPVTGFVDLIARLGRPYPERRLTRAAETVGRGVARPFVSRHRQILETIASTQTPASLRMPSAVGLSELVRRGRPKVVLEFGTGYSTLLLAALSKAEGIGLRLVSVEHDPEWYSLQLSRLESPETELILAPLVEGAAGPEYDRGVVADALGARRPDLVLVDGPVGVEHGGPGRRGSLLQALELVSPAGVVLLHDALRKDELGLVRELQRTGQARLGPIVLDADGLVLFRAV
jgi:predicted O-methyltransferase YrrM